ncbi:MAG: hypothetical protein QXF17_07040 [Ignisphaera sp.]
MILTIEELRKMMIDIGFEKIYLVEEEPNCVVYIGIYKGKEIIVTIFKGISAVYAKMIPADLLPTSNWHCHYIKYSPIGWYIFSSSISDLVMRLGKKLSKIIELKYSYNSLIN